MDEDVKICPQCGAEYFPHIIVCAGCDVPLIRPDEAPKAESPDPTGSLVCVEEGDIHRVKELGRGLGSAGIEYEIMKIDAGGSGGCGRSADFGLFVDSALAGAAVRVIDEFLRKTYPELKDARDTTDEGVCPACGADVRGSTECPDCGLNLEGGGPGGDSCGGCGPACGH